MLTTTVPALTDSRLTWAQWYAHQGWPILPMHTPTEYGCSCQAGAQCPNPGKHPRTAHGRKDASTDQQTIAAWWKKWPDANIALKTDGFFVLDIDDRHQGKQSLAALEQQYGRLPEGPRVISGSGSNHYYFLLPKDGIAVYSSDGLVALGVDIKCYQGNINLPPSLHASGQQYAWDALFSPDSFELPHPPEWLVTLARQARPASQASYEAGVVIPDGGRYHYFISLAGRLRHSGFTEDEIFDTLVRANQKCQTPEDEKELRKYARWAGKQDTADPYQLNPASLEVAPPASNALPPASKNGTVPPQPWGTPRHPIQLTDLADMLDREYPLPRWLIKGLIPEGLIFFIGSPKSSKTYLGYSLALSLAYEAQRGGEWLDHYPVHNPGPVVYITLEDDEADSRFRIAELAPWLKTIERDKFLFVHGYEFPRFDEGLVTVLEEEIIKKYQPALVVLDPISYLYSPIKKSGDQFSEVRDMLLPLRWLGRRYHCTIAGIDHRRKKSADDIDIFETQYGSVSKGAIADAMYVIVRDDKEVTLHARLRKGADQTLTLGFEFNDEGAASWTWRGAVDGLVGQGQYGDLRQRVIEALSGSQIPLSIADILAGLNIPDSKQTRNAIYQILFRAQKNQEIQKTTRGQYVWAGGN